MKGEAKLLELAQEIRVQDKIVINNLRHFAVL